jgi:nucleolar protein 53
MGKKLRGAKLRSYQRSKRDVEELQESQADAVARGTIQHRSNADLFVLDNAGDVTSQVYKNAIATGALSSSLKKKKNQDEEEGKKRGGLSEQDLRLVERLHAKHKKKDSNDGAGEGAGVGVALLKLAQQGRRGLQKGQNKRQRSISAGSKNSRINYDLWGDGGEPAEERSSSANQARTATSTEAETMANESVASSSSGTRVAAGTRPDRHVRPKAAGGGAYLRSHIRRLSPSGALPASAPSSLLSVEKIKVDVASAGQSYHPDPVLHRMSLQQALVVETRRMQALQNKTAPLATGMSEETRKLLVGDSSSSDDDDDDSKDAEEDEKEEAVTATATASSSLVAPLQRKNTDKLTTAQRNKQKRVRQEQAERERQKELKRFLNQAGQAGTLKKELNRKEREWHERRAQREQLKATSRRVRGRNIELALSQQDPLRAPSVPVALPGELVVPEHANASSGSSGSGGGGTTTATLRTLRPKGSLVWDRFGSFSDRGMAVLRNPTARAARKRKIKLQGAIKGPGFEIKG